jgi:hypothetical protein
MTNRELIVQLLSSDMDAEVDLKKTIGDMEFRPALAGRWVADGQHAVYCSHCNCRVSRKASMDMKYCFICGAKMEGLLDE